MGTLIQTLAERLPAGAVRTSSPVERILRDGEQFTVEVRGEAVRADRVILAAPAKAAARVVPDEELARELGGIETVSTATVFLALRKETVRHSLRGFGFIVPDGEAKILASTWVSSKWNDRAPAGMALVRAFVGGARDPGRVESSLDEELVLLARTELERLMGPLGEPVFTRVYRYTDANPQPNVGHGARLGRIAARLAKIPGLHVAGASYDGVGIPDCVRQAREAARTALTGLSAPSAAAEI